MSTTCKPKAVIQFDYGWNSNVEHRRNYFGVGFDFIEMGKELTKYIGK